MPVCGNEKFNLVHKFPADKERFNLWINAIQKSVEIEKFAGLTSEAIRKRFFVCSRHFGLKEYKNIESRGLNQTAVPHLNLENLEDLELSKAWQIQLNRSLSSFEASDNILELNAAQESAPKVRILNTEIVVKPSPVKAVPIVKTPMKEEPDIIVDSPPKPPTKRKRSTFSVPGDSMNGDGIENEIRVMTTTRVCRKRAKLDEVEEPKPQEVNTQHQFDLKQSEFTEIKEEPSSMKELRPQNKLLALIEVTPEQFERLNKSMTAAERTENVTSLINFMNNDELDLQQADNGNNSLFNHFKTFQSHFLSWSQSRHIMHLEIEIVLEDDRTLRLDLFWLRDHCRCETCYDYSTHQRKLSILDIPDDINANSYLLEGESLIIICKLKTFHQLGNI